MLILLYALMAIVSLVLGYKMGWEAGTIKGVLVGKDLEFYLFGSSLKKLQVQTKYNDLMDDVKKQYEIELKNLATELKSREG